MDDKAGGQVKTPKDEQKQAEPRVRTCSRCNEDCHDILHKTGIIEIAVRNQSVSEYMRHWEVRTERAEADLAEAVAVVRELVGAHLAKFPPSESGSEAQDAWAHRIADSTIDATKFLAKHPSAVSGERG